jgi:hypothetical protein
MLKKLSILSGALCVVATFAFGAQASAVGDITEGVVRGWAAYGAGEIAAPYTNLGNVCTTDWDGICDPAAADTDFYAIRHAYNGPRSGGGSLDMVFYNEYIDENIGTITATVSSDITGLDYTCITTGYGYPIGFEADGEWVQKDNYIVCQPLEDAGRFGYLGTFDVSINGGDAITTGVVYLPTVIDGTMELDEEGSELYMNFLHGEAILGGYTYDDFVEWGYKIKYVQTGASNAPLSDWDLITLLQKISHDFRDAAVFYVNPFYDPMVIEYYNGVNLPDRNDITQEAIDNIHAGVSQIRIAGETENNAAFIAAAGQELKNDVYIGIVGDHIDLPWKMSFRIDFNNYEGKYFADEDVTGDEIFYLYYLNEETGKLEEYGEVRLLGEYYEYEFGDDYDGRYFEIDLDHFSEYVITTTQLASAEGNNGDDSGDGIKAPTSGFFTSGFARDAVSLMPVAIGTLAMTSFLYVGYVVIKKSNR